MVDTAGTLCKAAEVLKEFGARRVFAFASHGVFSGPAPTRIANSVLTELVVLDTVPLSEESAVSQFYFILFIFVFIFVVITKAKFSFCLFFCLFFIFRQLVKLLSCQSVLF